MARRRKLNSDQWRRSQLFINEAGEQYGRTAHTHTMQRGAATVAGHNQTGTRVRSEQSVNRPELARPQIAYKIRTNPSRAHGYFEEQNKVMDISIIIIYYRNTLNIINVQ
jgi:hypothetical protein